MNGTAQVAPSQPRAVETPWLNGGREIAAYIGISRGWLYKLIAAGDPIATVIRQRSRKARMRARRADVDRVMTESYGTKG